jgi:DNA invertase Pin-like site-specific DNA recombinase
MEQSSSLVSTAMMSVIGYARASSEGQTFAAQTEALHGAGCAKIYSGKSMELEATDRNLRMP